MIQTLLFHRHQLIVLHFQLNDTLVKTTVFDNYQDIPMFLINNWVKHVTAALIMIKSLVL